jgi:hypothetical protein
MDTIEWTDAAATDDVPADDVIGILVAGRDIALYNAGGEINDTRDVKLSMVNARMASTMTARIAMIATARLEPPLSLEVDMTSAINPPARMAPALQKSSRVRAGGAAPQKRGAPKGERPLPCEERPPAGRRISWRRPAG